MSRQRLTKLYMLLVIGGGIPVIVYSLLRLPLERIDLQFLALAIMAFGISSRLTVRIPCVRGHISVSYTFLFLSMLFYGVPAALLLATAGTLCSSIRFSKNDIHFLPVSMLSIV